MWGTVQSVAQHKKWQKINCHRFEVKSLDTEINYQSNLPHSNVDCPWQHNVPAVVINESLQMKSEAFSGSTKSCLRWPKKQTAAAVEICLIIKAHPRKLDEAGDERYLWAGDGKADETLMPILPAFFLNLNVFTYNNTITVLFLWPTRHSCFPHSLKIQNDCGIDFFFLPRKTFYISTRDLFVCWRKAEKRFFSPPHLRHEWDLEFKV